MNARKLWWGTLIAGATVWLGGTAHGGLTITNNPLGTATLAPNPMAATIPTTDLTFEGNGQGIFDRSINNGSRTRITSGSATTGWFRFSRTPAFPVGTVILADYCWNGWGGTYTYNVVLNDTIVRANETGVFHLKRTVLVELPQAIGNVTNLTASFSVLQNDHSGTWFECWLVPQVLRKIPLTGASVTAYGATTYGAPGELFDNSLDNEYLVRNYDGNGRRGIELDLGGTRSVRAVLFVSSWRPTGAALRYYNGTWNVAAGFGCTGDDGDLIVFSTPLAASKIGFEYSWDYSDGWAGPREIMIFEDAPNPVPDGALITLR